MNKTDRKSKYSINDLLLHRWSPRAMSGQAVSEEELNTLFEAARWAPSSYNNQPWRFVYAKKNSIFWDAIFNLMVPSNQQWAKNAGVLIVVVSKNDFEKTGKPSRTHSFDAGAAMENLALQGYAMGLVIHGMEGFNYDKAKEVINLPEGYTVEALFAVGRPGAKEDLPIELQERERASDRKNSESFVFEGVFKERE